jgi:hypothetical protein
VWTADFKGQFRTGNGVYCSPLTIADQHTRFLLECRGLLSTETATARAIYFNTVLLATLDERDFVIRG